MEVEEKSLIHSKEKIYFWVALIVSILTLIVLIVSVVGIIILVGLVLISYCLYAISVAHIRANGVKISDQQFPEFYQYATELGVEMKMKKMPDIYILQSGGMLNAFATRFFRSNMVVLYSELFEVIMEDYGSTTSQIRCGSLRFL